MTWEERRKVKEEKLKAKVSEGAFKDYYTYHSLEETALHFSIKNTDVIKLVHIYNFHKPKDAHVAQIKKSKKEKYGDENYNNRDKSKQTCLEKYDVDNPFKDIDNMKKHYQEKLGVDHPMKLDSVKEKVFENRDYKEISKKSHKTYFEKTGYENPFSNPDVINNIVQKRFSSGQYTNLEHTEETCMEKYGVPYPCMRKEARLNGTSDSTDNKFFEQLLINNNIKYEREFPIGKFSYDFKVDNVLIEIDPTATHNSTWRPFHDTGLDKNYHLNKTNVAKEHGFRCIHIFDWDDKQKIINLLKNRQSVPARKCVVKCVSVEDAKSYLNDNHLQGYVQDSIRLGLFFDDTLISLMTFGKPRYNKHFELELLRYCSTYYVIGGAEKLFSYFIKNYNPQSVISYCDNAKFDGNVYEKLGFVKHDFSNPSKHWYSLKTKKHITDNLLRKQGFDRLFGTNYGKGTSNEQLMLQNKFVEVYDCGQYRWEWNNCI